MIDYTVVSVYSGAMTTIEPEDTDCDEADCPRCRQDEDELRAEKRDELMHEDLS